MAEETEKTSIKQLIQGMTGGEVTVIQGKVVSTSPLKIQAVNDDKLMIYQNSLFVPRHLTDYTTSCELSMGGEHSYVTGPTSDGSRLTSFAFGGTIVVHNALKAGEVVHLLSLNHGKQYYILDRV